MPEQQALVEHLRESILRYRLEHSDRHAYALVYGVAYPSLFANVLEQIKPQAASQLALIFDASGETQHEQYGPFLVELTADRDALLTQTLLTHCVADPRGMSFIFSRHEIDGLAEGLRERLPLQCEDGTTWQLKFFDSRTLPILASALTAEQQRSFFRISREWWFLDRERALQRLTGNDESRDDYRAPLRLSEQQAAAFIDAAVPDSVLYILERTDDDLTSAFEPHIRYRIVEAAVASASDEERNSTTLLADRARLELLAKLNERDQA
ncbi:DUF4123 domain-containing protein [Trinickia terrae]|nr:DUF4123 domain-containing protein [Trinickia terrae]